MVSVLSLIAVIKCKSTRQKHEHCSSVMEVCLLRTSGIFFFCSDGSLNRKNKKERKEKGTFRNSGAHILLLKLDVQLLIEFTQLR